MYQLIISQGTKIYGGAFYYGTKEQSCAEFVKLNKILLTSKANLFFLHLECAEVQFFHHALSLNLYMCHTIFFWLDTSLLLCLDDRIHCTENKCALALFTILKKNNKNKIKTTDYT